MLGSTAVRQAEASDSVVDAVDVFMGLELVDVSMCCWGSFVDDDGFDVVSR